MKISDGIALLELLKKENGDLELISAVPTDDDHFIIRDDFNFEIVSKDGENFVCAFMPEILNEECEHRPTLTLVKH